MTSPRRTLVAAVALGLVLAGCGGSPADPAAADDPVDAPGGNSSYVPQDSMIDPAWPWPEMALRPDGIVYEFSAANPLGDGGIWQVDFPVGSLDEAQAFADALEADGWEFAFGQNDGIVEDDSASWVLTHGDLMGTISTSYLKESPIVMSFTIMGKFGS